MKKYFQLLIVLSILISCKPDEKVEPENLVESFRVSKVLLTNYGSQNEKVEYEYAGDLLSSVSYYHKISEDTNWYLMSTSDYSYDQNLVTSLTKYSTGQIAYKVEYIIENGILKESSFFNYNNQIWTKYDHTKYYYNGSIADSSIETFYIDNEFSLGLKKTFHYLNDKISYRYLYRSEVIGIWDTIKKTEFNYQDLSFGFITYNYNSFEYQPSWKEINTLSNHQITKKEAYMFWMGEYWELASETNYLYNSDGLLTDVINDGDNENPSGHIEYEKGTGNLGWFNIPENDHEGIPVTQKNRNFLALFPPRL